ncbi:MAG TPA: phosphate/phosphite/phosphonate ABC transporter substrate-binding protein [Polyangia bacterium]|nr:phosphate/phosphite/phosphonate ABC transporter substrate-binding protein [Polyangia bacterium]
MRCLLLVALAALGCKNQQPSPPPQALLLGTVPSQSERLRVEAIRPLAAYLQAQVGLPVNAEIAADYKGVLAALAARRYDVAITGPMIALRAQDGYRVVAKPVRRGAPTYRAQILVRADGPVRALGDLRGKVLALVDQYSESGYLVPRRMVRGAGLDPDRDLKKALVGTHDNAVLGVLYGLYDAGACFEGAEAQVLRDQPAQKERLRVLARSEPIPNDPVLVRRDLDAGTAAAIVRALLALDGRPEARAVLAPFGAESFVAASDGEYAALGKAE